MTKASPFSLRWKHSTKYEANWCYIFNITASSMEKTEMGSMRIQIIQRTRIAANFHSLMTQELMEFALSLFTSNGKLKNKLCTKTLLTHALLEI